MKLSLANRILKPKNLTFVMGIINATSDSFYKESRTNFSINYSVEKALKMIEDDIAICHKIIQVNLQVKISCRTSSNVII